MRGPDLKQRKLRPAPVRDGLRPSTQIPRPEQRRIYRVHRTASGLCVPCGQARGPEGTKTMCRRCADRHSSIRRQKVLDRITP